MVMPLDSSAIDAAKKGSADLLILALIEAEPLHGYEIAGRIDARSDGRCASRWLRSTRPSIASRSAT